MDAGPTQDDILAFFCEHLVSFCWYEGKADAQGNPITEPPFCMASGFILQVGDDWWLVTAGHVFTDYRKRCKDYDTQAFNPRLVDLWGAKRASHPAPQIPFDFFDDALNPIVVYDREKGLDYALIRIPYLQRQALQQTIDPFDRSTWANQGTEPFDRFIVLGSPNELKHQYRWSERDRDVVSSHLEPVAIFVDETDSDAAGIDPTTHPQFIGKLNPLSDVQNIGGMSGGPILGFRKDSDGRLWYFPVAIQSRWLTQSRIIVGTRVPIVGELVESQLTP